MILEVNMSITHAPRPSNECGSSALGKLSEGLDPNTVWALLFRAHNFV